MRSRQATVIEHEEAEFLFGILEPENYCEPSRWACGEQAAGVSRGVGDHQSCLPEFGTVQSNVEGVDTAIQERRDKRAPLNSQA